MLKSPTKIKFVQREVLRENKVLYKELGGASRGSRGHLNFVELLF